MLPSRSEPLYGKRASRLGFSARLTQRFTCLGRTFRLAVKAVRDAEVGSARMERGWLEVRVGQELRTRHRAGAVRKALVAWYRDRVGARLPSRPERFAMALDLFAPPAHPARSGAALWGLQREARCAHQLANRPSSDEYVW